MSTSCGTSAHVIDTGALSRVYQLLSHDHKKSIKKEACWTISNITAGNKAQIQAVMDANIIYPILHLLQHSEFAVKREAAWAVSNVTSRGSEEQIKFLVDQGCIKALCDLLICPDRRIVTVCLEGLDNILKAGEAEKMTIGVNIFAQMVDECEGLDKIEDLQTHDNDEIYKKAIRILEKFWDDVEEQEEILLDGVNVNQQGFNLGTYQPIVTPGGFNFG